MRTRWYQSLSLRLLILFWLLFFGVASSSYLLALWFSKPVEPQPLSANVQNTLTPLLSDSQTFASLTPGRLLAGDFRVVASLAPQGQERLQVERNISSSMQRLVLRQLEAEQEEQIPYNNQMLIGPFENDGRRILLVRPLTLEERRLQVVSEQEAQEAQTTALLIGSGLISIVLGVWLVRPLKRLTQATREIAKGSESPQLHRLPKRSDELGELARALSTTARDLAVSRDAQRRLLSDVSHELRSPLARMQVALMLSQDDDTPTDNPHLQQMGRDLERLSTIIERILSLSRLENGLVKLTRVDVDTRELVEQLAADLSYVDAEQGRRVHVLPKAPEHGDWPVLSSDSELLRLVLENLVRNALQYTSELIELRCEKVDNVYHIFVRDFGEGVPEEQLQKLFEPFFRGDPSRHHKAGVGLGMALSLRAALVLGGKISAQNHPDGGLEVCVSLLKDGKQ